MVKKILILQYVSVGERSICKSYHPVSLLSVVSKGFEKLVNIIIDHLEKCDLFSISGMVLGLPGQLQIFWQLCQIRALNSSARAFNSSWAARAAALDISKAFGRVWHARIFHRLRSYGISGQIFSLISSFLSNRRPSGGSGWEVFRRTVNYWSYTFSAIY